MILRLNKDDIKLDVLLRVNEKLADQALYLYTRELKLVKKTDNNAFTKLTRNDYSQQQNFAQSNESNELRT